jgi:HEAT repeat protein
MPPPEELRAAALTALAELVRCHGLDSSWVMEAVKAALVTGGDIVIAAAFDALARHPDLAAPVPLESALRHPDVRVRRAAMKANWARMATLPTGRELERLLSDPEPGVRNLLAELAAELGHEGSHVISRLVDDADAWVRAWARKLQSRLQVS